jgi:hypothetical protein
MAMESPSSTNRDTASFAEKIFCPKRPISSHKFPALSLFAIKQCESGMGNH